MANLYQKVIIQIKMNKLKNILARITHEREKEFLQRHIPKYIHFYNYFISKLFSFLKQFKSNIAWKVIYNGVSFYTSSERSQDGRFMSIVFQADNKLKFIFFQGINKQEKDFKRNTREGRDPEYYWYYVENLQFDRELARLIINSYKQKKTYLKYKENDDYPSVQRETTVQQETG